MRTLQERMDGMKPYFRAIEMYNEALIVRMMFPKNWKAYDSQDGRIKATPSDDNPNEIYYYADSSNTSYEDMFDLIEETMKANQDVILKIKLLRTKVEELKEIFSKTSYDELKTLRFEMDKPKKVRARKPKKTKEETITSGDTVNMESEVVA